MLIRLSLACRLLSSNKSLTAVTPNTNITGIMAISLPKALMAGTQLSNTIKMKYKLATLWNCSSKFLGKNDNSVYLVVLIRLLGRLPFGCSFLGVFGGTMWFGTTKRQRSSWSFFGERNINAHNIRRHNGGGVVLRNVYIDSDLQQKKRLFHMVYMIAL